MNQKNDTPIIYQIVNRLQENEKIQYKIVDKLSFNEVPEISADLGLVNLFYNLAINVKKLNEENRERGDQNREGKRMDMHNNGKILQIRGQILRQIGKFLAPVLPQPAFSLATFDFEEFNKFCNDRGLFQLINHSQGIYPQIDTNKTQLLQFLPFNGQTEDKGPAILGNKNWKCAKNLLENAFDMQIKNGTNFFNRYGQNNEELNHMSQEEEQLYNGIRLSYILLTGRKREMEEYISNLRDSILKSKHNDRQKLQRSKLLLERFQFWYYNYSKFIEQGIEYYEAEGLLSKSLPIIYGISQQHNNLEQILIYLIEKTVEIDIKIKGNPIKRDISSYIGAQFRQKFVLFIQHIQNNMYLFLDGEKNNQNQLYSDIKCMLLSYVYVIHKLLLPNINLGVSPLAAFLEQATFTNPQEEPYYRIFFDDEQLLQLYESGKVNEFPTYYNYGPELMPKILKSIIKNNPNRLFFYLDKVNLLNQTEQIKLIISNPLIGDITNVIPQSNKKTPGQQVLDYFEKNCKQFSNLLYNEKGNAMNQIEALKFYASFVKDWAQVYDFFRNFSIASFANLLLKYESAQNPQNGNESVMKNELDEKLSTTTFIFPLKRPDIFYHLINSLTTFFEMQKNKYLLLLEQSESKSRNEAQLKTVHTNLLECYKIFTREDFKNMVEQCDPNYETKPNLGNEIGEQYVRGKEEFEDWIWSVYAQVTLLLGETCKNLLSSAEGSRKKSNRIPSGMMHKNNRSNLLLNKDYFEEVIDLDDEQPEQDEIQRSDVMEIESDN